MEQLINQILTHKEAAALPSLLESGGLPALVSGLSAVHRANLAAGLRDKTGAPLFVICPDDTAAENFANDLRAMTQARGAFTLAFDRYEEVPGQLAQKIIEAHKAEEEAEKK